MEDLKLIAGIILGGGDRLYTRNDYIQFAYIGGEPPILIPDYHFKVLQANGKLEGFGQDIGEQIDIINIDIEGTGTTYTFPQDSELYTCYVYLEATSPPLGSALTVNVYDTSRAGNPSILDTLLTIPAGQTKSLPNILTISNFSAGAVLQVSVISVGSESPGAGVKLILGRKYNEGETFDWERVGLVNTGNGYIAFFFDKYKTAILKSNDNPLFFDNTSAGVYFNEFYGGNILYKPPFWVNATWGEETTTSTYSDSFYPTVGGTNSVNSISGYIYASTPAAQMDLLAVASVGLTPYLAGYKSHGRPTVGSGVDGLNVGVEREYLGLTMKRYPCQDGFSQGASGTRTDEELGEFGSVRRDTSTANGNSSAKIGHSYSWFGYRVLRGRRASLNFTLTHTRHRKEVSKIEPKILTLNGLHDFGDVYVTEEWNTTYNESCNSSSEYTQSVQQKPSTDPITIEVTGGYDDIFGGGGNSLTWSIYETSTNVDATHSMNYFGDYVRTKEIPRLIYGTKIIYEIDNQTRTASGNFTWSYSLNAQTLPGGTSVSTTTQSTTGSCEQEFITTISETEGIIQGINCAIKSSYETVTTYYKKNEVDTSWGDNKANGAYNPTTRIRYTTPTNSNYQYITRTGFSSTQLGGTITEKRAEEGGNLNGEYPNTLTVYIENTEYEIKQDNADKSLCFMAYIWGQNPDYSDTTVGDVLDLTTTLFNFSHYIINAANGWTCGDKELVTSAGQVTTDLYAYTVSPGYVYEYRDAMDFEIWRPATGTRSSYEFQKNPNPHYLGNYDGIEVDAFLKTAGSLYLHCIATLNVDYTDYTSEYFGNDFTYSNLDGYKLTITEVVGLEYLGVRSYSVERDWDQVIVITKDNYNSWITALTMEWYDIQHNLYSVTDEQGNETVELAISEQKPSNNSFGGAVLLEGQNVSVRGNNYGADWQGTLSEPSLSPPTQSVWYKWVAPSSTPVTIHTLGSPVAADYQVDTVIAVYTGDSLDSLSLVASNDDASVELPPNGDYLSAVVINPTEGTTYYIQVDGWSDTQWSFVLSISTEGLNVPTPIQEETRRADIYRFDTQTLKWKRMPNAVSAISPLTGASDFISYHATPQTETLDGAICPEE